MSGNARRDPFDSEREAKRYVPDTWDLCVISVISSSRAEPPQPNARETAMFLDGSAKDRIP